MPTFFTGSSKLVRATTSATLHTIATTSNAAGVVNLRNDDTTHAFAVLDDGTGSLPDRRVVIPPGKSVKLARGTQQTTLKITNASVLATPGYLRKNDKFREFVNLSNAARNITSLEQVLGRRLPYIVSVDWEDLSAVVRDWRLENNYIGDVNGLVTNVTPSTQYLIGDNGFYYPGDTIRTELDIFGNPLGSRIEVVRTNLLLQSANIRFASPWSTPAEFSSVELANSIFQDQVAWKYSINAINADRTQVITVALSTAYTLSCIVEQVSAAQTEIGLFNGTVFNGFLRYTWATQALSVVSGTVSSSSVTDLGIGPNGGKLIRLAATITSDAALTSAFFIVYLAGFERTSGAAIIHHAQIEAGSFPTSPIVTTTAAVTRNANDYRLELIRIPYTIGIDQPFMHYAESALFGTASGVTHLAQDLIQNNNDHAYIGVVNSNFRAVSASSLGANCDIGIPGSIVNVFARQAARFALNDCAECVNGGTVGTDNTFVFPNYSTSTRLDFGSQNGGELNGWLKKSMFVPEYITDAELQAFTALSI